MLINEAGERLEDTDGTPFVTSGIYEGKFFKQQKAEYLKYCYSFVHPDSKGLVLEFGVYKGGTLKVIAKDAKRKVYGFDSFKGLTEDWGGNYPKGTFVLDQLPDLKEFNIELIPGFFQDTLVTFLQEHPEPVAFLHMDADLYSSTSYVLQTLKDRIIAGTVIVFDEIQNSERRRKNPLKQDPTYQEAQAFREFLATTDLKHTWLAYTSGLSACAILHN